MGKDQELLEAARNGNVAVVEKILWQRAKRSGPLASLRRGPGANVQDSSGYSALHHAALNGHKDVVKLLLHHEASTNIVDAKGSSPLHLAAWSGSSEIVRLILSQGPSIPNVNLTTKDNETALHCAAQYGHTEVVEQLLQYRCDSSIRNNRGESALDLAAQYGRLETVELLVRTHPELIESLRSSSASLIFPHTPLHLASRNGHRACVEVLLVAGVYVNTRTSAGTAMHEAALCGKMEVVRTLLDRGVDLTIKDSRDNTVLDLLSQFPAHVTQDITAVIKKHRTSSGIESDADSEHLPPIPVQSNDSLGSPYENVQSGDEFSLEEGSSPTRWQIYHKPRDSDNGVSANSTIALEDALYEESLDEAWKHFQLTDDSDPSSVFDSVFISMSDTLNSINTLTSSDQTPEDKPLNTTLITTPLQATLRGSDSTALPNLCEVLPIPSTLMDTRESCASEDQLSLMLPEKYYGGKESDQLSISSSSSIGGPSSRERRCLPDSSSSGIYLPMTPLSNSQYSLTSSNKISNGVTLSTLQPPKKPPRRNLSVSPIHLQTDMTYSAESHIVRKDYDYLFLAHSGSCKWTEEEQSQEHNKILRRIYHRADQYVDMKSQEQQQKETQEKCVETEFRVDTSITYVLENRPMRITNSDKKLHKHMYGHSKYENCHIDSMLVAENSPKSKNVHDPEEIFVSNAVLTLKSSQECLVEEKLNHSRESQIKISEKYLKRMQILLPTSPTHYIQPPTPDHPPPSAIQAEESIHERIRPLSQVYKRRSRDMETETEEELLQFPASDSLNASSGSLSLASIFDKSMSTDNVEEYFGDMPFAGLLKGSVSALERPRTLRRLRKVYSPAIGGNGMGNDVNVTGEQRLDQQDLATTSESDNYQLVVGREQSDETRLNLMSPFDEQEEWAKISEIMASFGTGLIRESIFVNELEKEFETRLGLNTDTGSPCALTLVGQWLSQLNLTDYESLFINYGFDDLEFINGVIDMKDLKEMGINSEKECSIIMDAVMLLNNQVGKQPDVVKTQTVDDWLKSIHLDNYTELFRRHLYTDMDRVRRVWEVELAAVLEIQKPAHRKRILTSVKCDHMSNSASHMGNNNGPNLEDLNKDLDALNTNIQQLKEEIREKLPDTEHNISNFILPTSESTAVTTVTGTTVSATSTLKHRKNRPAPQPPQVLSIHNGTLQTSEYLEIRGPSELLFGVPSTLQTQWRHQPNDLVTGCVTYIANYLGSTVVKELRGTESTKKSIQKLKMIYRDPKGTPDITLSISYRGVRFLNTLTNEPICEHEIRNIHCACQDADDLTHFAYITKDHISRTHFCHVFCVLTMDQATEIILTLGQAFEVAYQLAIKDKISSHAIRSQSANQLTNLVSSVSKNFTTTTITDTPLKELSHNNFHLIESINHNCINSKSKANSKSNIFTTVNISTSNTSSKPPPIQEQQNKHKISSPDKLFCYSNFHSDSISKNLKSNSKPINNNHSIVKKLLSTHDHSHSVNDIKINGNQLNRISTPVDDISIDVKDMKAGSRAPIVLSEEL